MRTPTREGLLATGALAFCLLAAAACSRQPDPATPPDAATALDAGADAGGVECPGCDAGAVDAGSSDAGTPDAGTFTVRVRQVVPSRGPAEGGTSLTVEGGGFYLGFASGSTAARPDTHVFFGSNEATELRIIDDDTLEVTAPPHRAGTVDLIVQNPNGEARCEGCFTYFVELALSTLQPASGALEGCEEIELSGEGFGEQLSVLFGGRASPKVTVVDDRLARAVVPAGAQAGAVDVLAFNKNGSVELRRGFRYLEGLELERLDPPYAPLAGGGRARLLGRGLAEAVEVLVGTQVAAFSPVGDGELELVVPPASTAGAVAIEVRTAAGSATLRGGLVYFDPGQAGTRIAGVWPHHGPAAGGNRVLLIGSGLDPLPQVGFGGSPATGLSLLSANVLELSVPAGTAHSFVDVSAGAASLPGGYRYDVALGALSPTSGSSRGGESVTLEGAGFAEGIEVRFGPLASPQVSVLDSGRLTAVAPPGAGGAVDVAVGYPSEPGDEAKLAAAYRYVEPLGVARLWPDVGAIAGGTLVTVLGAGFEPGVVVEIGGAPLKDARLVDAHTLVGRTPPGEIGAVDVVVRKGGARDVTPGGFTYFDPTTVLGGSSGGPINGTLNVTVLEGAQKRLQGATVRLGDDPETPMQGRTDRRGQITFSDPQLVRAQRVTVSKEGYLTLTVERQASRDLTVYLYSDGTSSSGGGGIAPEFSASSGPSIISGRVTGFKLPRPLEAGEIAMAEVWVAPTTVYSTPPLGWMATPEMRDARGERWRISRDGGSYSVFAGKGLRAVYALFGILQQRTGTFTPYLMGLRRGVTADPDKPAVDKDVVLDMHLDAEIPVTVESPPWLSSLHRPALHETYAWLELGGEGVVPFGPAVSDFVPPLLQVEPRPERPMVLRRVPRLDGGNFVFLNRSSTMGREPESYCFRRQLGDLSGGVTVGPMLGLFELVRPARGETFTGEIAWSLGSGPAADLTQLTVSWVSASGYRTLWQVILPGSQLSVTLPDDLMDELRATSGTGARLYVSLQAVRSPRFEYQHWSYSHFSLDSWTSWTTGTGEIALP